MLATVSFVLTTTTVNTPEIAKQKQKKPQEQYALAACIKENNSGF